jgi:flavin-dependent dehydrogenase
LGYFWIFPRDTTKREINLGMGVIDNSQGSPKELLMSFKQEQGIKGDVNYVTGGLIPVGLQKPLRHENILFVGDAGVGTFPITGEGTPRAILNGILAAHCIVSEKPGLYPRIVKQEFFRWDLLGKTCIRSGRVMQRIGDKAYDRFLNSIVRFVFSPAFF